MIQIDMKSMWDERWELSPHEDPILLIYDDDKKFKYLIYEYLKSDKAKTLYAWHAKTKIGFFRISNVCSLDI